ncbi:MAG: Xaa-Pro peptidase family protein [Planctomycetia bacterium]|nr:Xaa-Pro peptidase family protein [Planctomycetia bacterium]
MKDERILEQNAAREELDGRRERFLAQMEEEHPDWTTAVLVDRVNMLYFCGTMQDGILVFRRDGARFLFVRRSFERACDESRLPTDEILPMRSFRDMIPHVGENWGETYFELEVLPVAMLERLRRYFRMDAVASMDRSISKVRAIKSAWELAWMRKSGEEHRVFLEEKIPELLRTGISEADFAAALYDSALRFGYQGVSRFSMFQNEVGFGQYGFGENSLYPTNFDGPGGSRGMSAAIPFIGSRERTLQPGDSVFADMGYGVNGYHTDKTQVYFFTDGDSRWRIPTAALEAHEACREIQIRVASMLRPGARPSEIYREIMESLSSEFLVNFQGFGSRQVKFLGHGIGLHVDEYPVLARGFDDPLEENMVLAVEPKKGVAEFGTVGVEDTYLVTTAGGVCLTGGGREILVR